MELTGFVKNDSWGKIGLSSLVAQLARKNHDLVIENKPYSELWMGVHASGPSLLKSTKKSLADHILEHPEELGDKVRSHFKNQWPFLLKVLSIEQALSIQAHPSKKLAEQLYEAYPNVYKDANHKPELAISLTTFEALCGFRPLLEIKKAIEQVPPLKKLIGFENVEGLLEGNLRKSFESLMNASASEVSQVINDILTNYNTPETALMKRLNHQFPNDIGVLCVFFLNYLTLTPGEAIYLPANEPHAYIYGDCVECMANSDNVVRAGLTPKFRDVTTLCSMLTYKSYEPKEILFEPVIEDPYSYMYCPPVEDFAVVRLIIPSGVYYTLKQRKSASVLLCIEGEAVLKSQIGIVNIKSGVILYAPSLLSIEVSEVSQKVVIFQAICNL